MRQRANKSLIIRVFIIACLVVAIVAVASSIPPAKAVRVSMTFKVTMLTGTYGGAPQEMEIDGCNAVPNSFLADGASHVVQVDDGVSWTLSFDNPTIHVQGTFSDAFYHIGTTSSGATVTESGYQQVQNTFRANGLPSGDSVELTGFYRGIGSTIASLTGSSPQATFYCDYGSSVTYPGATANSGASERWAFLNALSYTTPAITSADSTYSRTYYHQYLFTLGYTIIGGGTPSAPVIRGTQAGDAGYITNTLPFTGWLDAATTWYMGTATTTQTNILQGSTSTEQWATNQDTTGTVTAAVTATFTYYRQVSNTFKAYSFSPGGLGTCSYSLTGVLFGTGGTTVITLNAGNGWNAPAWNDYGQAVTFPVASTPVSGERWQFYTTPISTVPLLSGGNSFSCYGLHQYAFQVSYSTVPFVDPTYPTAPTLTATQANSPLTPALTATPTTYWLDVNTAWSITDTLTPSDADNRWFSPATLSGTVTAATTLSPAYYYQVSNTFKVDNLWHTSMRTCTYPITGTQFGITGTIATLSPSNNWQATLWTDGSQAVTFPATSTPVGGERWQFDLTPYTMTGFLWGGHTYTVNGLHEFGFEVSYSISDATSPTAPTLTGKQYGIDYSATVTATPTTYWLDSGIERSLPQHWSLTAVLSGSDSLQRWSATGTLSGYVTSALTLSPTYYHQYSVAFSYASYDSSVISSGTQVGSYTKFGSAAALTSTATYGAFSIGGSDWADAGTSVTYNSPITLAAGTERYLTAPSDSGTVTLISAVDAPHNVAAAAYYHQLSVSFGYTTNDGSQIRNQPNLVTYTKFGGNSYLGTNGAGAFSPAIDWADAGTAVLYSALSSSTERYLLSSADQMPIASVSSTARTPNPAYLHQYAITVSTSGNGAVNPATGFYNAGTIQTFTIAPNPGYYLVSLSVDGVSVGAPQAFPFNPITAPHTLSATFSRIIPSYLITVTAGIGGQITPGSVSVVEGQSQAFTIAPYAGFHIADVVVNGYSVGAVSSYMFPRVMGPQSISATFTQDPNGFQNAGICGIAQTQNSNGNQTATFSRGSSATFNLVLGTTGGNRDVVWRITVQTPDSAVWMISSSSASLSSTTSTQWATTTIPQDAQRGTWTATVQIYASDGLTPLAVTTLTFNVT